MANRCTLLVSSSSDAPANYDPDEGIAASNYGVPWFWLTLFSVEDLVVWPATDGGFGEAYTAAITPLEHAVVRSRARLQAARTFWPNQIDELTTAWLLFLDGLAAGWLGIWTEELSAMTGRDAWAAALRRLLDDVDRPSAAAFRDLLAQSSFDVGDSPPTEAALRSASGLATAACGYAWNADVPWSTPP